MADGHVTERDGYVRGRLSTECGMGAAVQGQRFVETTLAIEHIAQVAVQPGESKPIALSREDDAGLACPGQSFVVIAQVNQRLQCATEAMAASLSLPIPEQTQGEAVAVEGFRVPPFDARTWPIARRPWARQ